MSFNAFSAEREKWRIILVNLYQFLKSFSLCWIVQDFALARFTGVEARCGGSGPAMTPQ
jgi:hypothetical protein